eukprot:Lankesteria_metandrocarpae@DN2053_c0_g1_i1.p1
MKLLTVGLWSLCSLAFYGFPTHLSVMGGTQSLSDTAGDAAVIELPSILSNLSAIGSANLQKVLFYLLVRRSNISSIYIEVQLSSRYREYFQFEWTSTGIATTELKSVVRLLDNFARTETETFVFIRHADSDLLKQYITYEVFTENITAVRLLVQAVHRKDSLTKDHGFIKSLFLKIAEEVRKPSRDTYHVVPGTDSKIMVIQVELPVHNARGKNRKDVLSEHYKYFSNSRTQMDITLRHIVTRRYLGDWLRTHSVKRYDTLCIRKSSAHRTVESDGPLHTNDKQFCQLVSTLRPHIQRRRSNYTEGVIVAWKTKQRVLFYYLTGDGHIAKKCDNYGDLANEWYKPLCRILYRAGVSVYRMAVAQNRDLYAGVEDHTFFYVDRHLQLTHRVNEISQLDEAGRVFRLSVGSPITGRAPHPSMLLELDVLNSHGNTKSRHALIDYVAPAGLPDQIFTVEQAAATTTTWMHPHLLLFDVLGIFCCRFFRRPWWTTACAETQS